MDKGCLHINCGDGVGKTTAAVGLTVRAAGRNKNILFVQFLKGSPSGEIQVLEELPTVTVLRGQTLQKFTWDMTPEEKAEVSKGNELLLKRISDEVERCPFDLLVLDEAIGAENELLLDEEQLLDFLRTRPERLEVVLTGRNPSQALLDMADYVTEMRKVKHPFDKGVIGREGIEY